jgi:uncharacterized protein YbjT (DUF2867 family)
VPSAGIQPVAAADVASAVGRTAAGTPAGGIVEIAGPKPFRFDELIRRALSARDDPRQIVVDPDARYFGAALSGAELLPGENAQLGETGFENWLSQSAIAG